MNRYIHTIWCDDIRQELGNKPSFMGVYTGGIVLDRTPAVLSKLCAWTVAACDIDDSLQAVSISVERDDGEVL